MSKNHDPIMPEKFYVIADRVGRMHENWLALSQKKETCLQTNRTDGSPPSCCEFHQALHRMFERLNEQAADLEEMLEEWQQIRRDCFSISDSSTQIIIRRAETGYSFGRFSPAWFEMIDDLSKK